MKQILYILSAILLSSCSSTFYYSTLNTTNEYVEKVENGDFLLETDSLWIAYCFKGAGAPMQITIFNKLDEPLYVDWGRSAMIIDSMAFSYAGESVPFMEDDDLLSDSVTTSDSSIQLMSDHTAFIPPQTMISEIPFSLDPNFKGLDKKLYRNSNMVSKHQDRYKVKRIDFSTSDSPLQFKSYLTIYSSPDKPMIFEQDFYLSTLIKTGLKPKDLVGDMAERGDFFYIEQRANNNALYTTLGVIGFGGLLVIGIIYGDETYQYVDDYDYDY